ncbi:MAG TPA: sigma-70 family RNA polymerase sigma factor [Vicinamibacterales bacterium]|jgi:RNA polymerase sigma factor (TIGR02999 family)|nr:sigma-70 family RNA polymerase sigma factor [Vicinamibacterales bacterium]
MATPPEVTRLLIDWSDGRAEALDRLLPIVYGELHRLAQRQMRQERAGHTLQATALVHEAYLKLVDQRRVQWRNRAHFFGVAAQVMRRILVDHARSHAAQKRGGGWEALSLDDAPMIAVEPAVDVVALDDALNRLGALDVQQAKVVELRYFGGLTIDETAEVLRVSPATVSREWTLAKAWLFGELTQRDVRIDP